MRILLLLIILLLLNISLNLFRLMQTQRYYKKFRLRDRKLSEYVPAVRRLFNKAGTDQVFRTTKFAGKSISYCLGMDNYIRELDETFRQTIGVYKFRLRNTINPLYWLELPSRISTRYEWSTNSLLKKLFALLFWISNIVVAYFIEKILDLISPNFLSTLESILR